MSDTDKPKPLSDEWLEQVARCAHRAELLDVAKHIATGIASQTGWDDRVVDRAMKIARALIAEVDKP